MHPLPIAVDVPKIVVIVVRIAHHHLDPIVVPIVVHDIVQDHDRIHVIVLVVLPPPRMQTEEIVDVIVATETENEIASEKESEIVHVMHLHPIIVAGIVEEGNKHLRVF